MPTYIHNVCGGISHGTHAQDAENKDKQHDIRVNIREGKRKKHVYSRTRSNDVKMEDSLACLQKRSLVPYHY